MRFFFCWIYISCLPLIFLQAQTPRCVTTDYLNDQFTKNPELKKAYQLAFEQAQQDAPFQQSPPHNKSQDTVFRIPVVVHIVYTRPEENLPDSLVFSQIEVLNEAFRRQHVDTAQTREAFKGFSADAGIEFFLADTDPDGNSTNGITRTVGSPTPPLPFLPAFFDPFSDNVKSAANGGKDPWNPNRYLNIWVCNLTNGFGVLGYAYPPIANLPNWPANAAPANNNLQGVVIYHAVFGRNNPLAVGTPFANNNQGRTCVHEVGHFLGLRHVWGDGPCNEDDGIADTPPATTQASGDCAFNSNTCFDCMANLPDNNENYMDYEQDACMNMFSIGQTALMRSILRIHRPSLAIKVPGTLRNEKVTGSYRTLITPGDSFVAYHDLSTLEIDGKTIPLTAGQILETPAGNQVLRAGDSTLFQLGQDYVLNGTAFRVPDGQVQLDYTPDCNIRVRRIAGVSVEDYKTTQSPSWYPNPGRNSISIQQSPIPSELMMVDGLGRVLKRSPKADGSVDVESLSPGLYIIQWTDGQQIHRQRWMKLANH